MTAEFTPCLDILPSAQQRLWPELALAALPQNVGRDLIDAVKATDPHDLPVLGTVRAQTPGP